MAEVQLQTIKDGDFHTFTLIADCAELEQVEKGASMHTLFGAHDADGRTYMCHSRLRMAWRFDYPATQNQATEGEA